MMINLDYSVEIQILIFFQIRLIHPILRVPQQEEEEEVEELEEVPISRVWEMRDGR